MSRRIENDEYDRDYPYEEETKRFAYFNRPERKVIHKTKVGHYGEETVPYTVNVRFVDASKVEMVLNVGDYEFVVLAKEETDYMDEDDDFGVDTLKLKSVTVSYAKDTPDVRTFTDTSLDNVSDAFKFVFGFDDERTFALLREMFDELVEWYQCSQGNDPFDTLWLVDAVQALDDAMCEHPEAQDVSEVKPLAEPSDSESPANAA